MHEKTSCLVRKRMANSRQGRGHPATHPPGHPATARPPATATATRTCGHPATNDTPDHRPRPAGHPASRLSQPPGRPRPWPRPRPGHGHGHAHGHAKKKESSAAAGVQCRARSKYKNAQRQGHGCNWFGYPDGSTAVASGTGKSRRPAQPQRLENGHRPQKASTTWLHPRGAQKVPNSTVIALFRTLLSPLAPAISFALTLLHLFGRLCAKRCVCFNI